MKESYLKRAWAETHLDRIKTNTENFRRFLKPETELMCVVKANCYGSGDSAVVPYLQEKLGVKWFAVSNIEEAIRLREMGISGEILILGYTPPEYADELIKYNIIQTATDESHAVSLSEFFCGKRIRVHCALDTGMTRIGVHQGTVEQTCNAIERISKLKGISLEGMFTHFACADSSDEDDIRYTERQAAFISAADDELKKRNIELKHIHFLNSAGGIYHSDERSSLARLGIIMYGLKPNSKLEVPFKLEPVLDFKAGVSMVKEVNDGVYISYGRTYKTKSPAKIATITVGYADGYPRYLSNKGEVLIHGKRAKIVGRVCMDQIMCDVTDIDVKVGDTATLIGTDGNETITADDIADIGSTIGYEVICNISKRVPRVVYENGKQINILKY